MKLDFWGMRNMGCTTVFKLIPVFLSLVVIAVTNGVGASAVSATEVANSCIECHGQAGFRATDKKLYKYYRDWELSIHAQEGVTCSDCHGGDPKSSDKAKAHREDTWQVLSPVEYEQISVTCGRCHRKNTEAYRQTKHFKSLANTGRLHPTPTCATCHGSINTSIPKADSIAGICAHCHNAVTENHPEIPEIASYLIERLDFINSYYLHLISKGVLEQSPEFSNTVNKELSGLANTWHTLDLDSIEDKTLQIRTMLMKQGKKMRKDRIKTE